uniref:MBF1 n=1 Tax=Umbilicaria muhlenbergii TaxID=2738368 RepID=A0A2I4R843_9LECA|nr:MBF1 [Umbilicaria muehlenbergii]ASK39416.1 MBF1 [Umbilicaria muehlenbergii]ASK39417.1 MBF1 [Umbilicaria muehlenbergii]ASK39418.1 MBF1 [Umbilicaria muehlenbergii]
MDDWDTVTKIGSKTKGAASQRETVVRGKGALNAAARSGTIIGTEKKFAVGNAASKPGVEGQRLTKVDRADDIVAPPKMDAKIGGLIAARRSDPEGPYKMTQSELAKKINVDVAKIKKLESPGPNDVLDGAVLGKVEKALNMRFRGAKAGQPFFPRKS